MTLGYLPPRLPVSCLTMAPRFDTKTNVPLIANRGPLTELNKDFRTTSASTGGGVGNQLKKVSGVPVLKTYRKFTKNY